MDPAEIQHIKCRGCHKTFEPYRNKVWCSDQCRVRARWKKIQHDTKICHICGREFEPKLCSQKRCSKLCQRIWTRQYHYERYESNRIRRKLKVTFKACLYCGKRFEVVPANKKYCTNECKRIHRTIKRSFTKMLFVPKLRDVTEDDIKSSQFSEEIKEFKRTGKRIITFPEIVHSKLDVHIDDLGQDNEDLLEELSNFNKPKQ